MFEDAIGPLGVEPPAVFSQRFLVGDVDVEDGGAFEHLLRQMLKGGAVAAMLAAAGKFDQGRVFGVVVFEAALMFVIFHADAFDQQVPLVPMKKVALCIGMHPRLAHDLFEDRVLLEPDPQHGKVVEHIDLADVKALAPFDGARLVEEIHDFGFARRRPAQEDENVKVIFRHV